MRHVNIPTNWTGGEALSVVGFLDEVIRAVWRQHGRKMAHKLYPQEPQLSCFLQCLDLDDQIDDPSPF